MQSPGGICVITADTNVAGIDCSAEEVAVSDTIDPVLAAGDPAAIHTKTIFVGLACLSSIHPISAIRNGSTMIIDMGTITQINTGGAGNDTPAVKCLHSSLVECAACSAVRNHAIVHCDNNLTGVYTCIEAGNRTAVDLNNSIGQILDQDPPAPVDPYTVVVFASQSAIVQDYFSVCCTVADINTVFSGNKNQIHITDNECGP